MPTRSSSGVRQPNRNRRLLLRLALLPALWIGLAGAASAQTLSSTVGTDAAILSQFNLVTFGSYNQQNEVEGRVVVGGNLTTYANENVGFKVGGTTPTPVSGQTYGAVTVFGNVSGNNGSTNPGFNPTGNVSIQGTAAGTFQNLNGASFNVVGAITAGSRISGAGSVYTSQSSIPANVVQNTQAGNVKTGVAASTVFPYPSISVFQQPLTALSLALATLPSTPGVRVEALPGSSGNLTVNATADYTAGGKSYGVIATSIDTLTQQSNLDINNNGNAATIVLVTGNDPNAVLPALNNNSGTARDVIWDFVNAVTLQFAGTWYGTILAPQATITQQGGDLDGSVVVQGITQTKELHANALFAGDLSGLSGLSTPVTPVPEPSSMLVVGAGVAGLGLLRRTRTR